MTMVKIMFFLMFVRTGFNDCHRLLSANKIKTLGRVTTVLLKNILLYTDSDIAGINR